MKKVILLIALIGMSYGLIAQNETVNGNLIVNGGITMQNGIFNFSPTNGSINNMGIRNAYHGMLFYYDLPNYQYSLFLKENGKVGIGTTNPSQKLHIENGNLQIGGTTNSQYGISFWRNSISIGNIDSYGNVFRFAAAQAPNNYQFVLRNNGDAYFNDTQFYLDYSTANVGIGTSTPGAKLEVKAEAGDYIRVNSSDATISASNKFGYKISELGIDVGELSYARDGQGVLRLNTLVNNDIAFGTNNSEKMRISKTGNIGIGTSSPSAKLEVKGVTIINGGIGVPSSGTLHVRQKGDSMADGIAITSSYAVSHRLWKDDNGSFNIGPTSLPSTIVSTVSGNVGIGTSTPDAKLAVNGKIHTKEVKVDLVGWSDFVFKKEYKLPTLKEVENHIKQKGHLKDIPSAKEVEKNGIFLGEMNTKLLQKIEELTLYTIEQEKKLDKKDKEFKILSERLTAIEKLLQEK